MTTRQKWNLTKLLIQIKKEKKRVDKDTDNHCSKEIAEQKTIVSKQNIAKYWALLKLTDQLLTYTKLALCTPDVRFLLQMTH